MSPGKKTPFPREPMDVGLDRHNRNNGAFPIPAWAEERFGMVVVVTLILIVALPLGFLGTNPTEDQPSETAQIAVTYGPAKAWKPGSSTHLESIYLKIQNIGPGAAAGVLAQVEIRGALYTLDGPPTIEPGKVEVYKGPVDLNFISSDAITPHISCWNCPLSPGGRPTEEPQTGFSLIGSGFGG